jgi:hypothetical protein
MRRIIALSLLVGLPACSALTPAQETQIEQTLSVVCDVDGALVPVLQPIVAQMGQTGANVANTDSLLVHPAVVAACQALNGKPASVTPLSPPVPVAAPSVPTPASFHAAEPAG